MEKTLRIALAQINTTVGDFKRNVNKILDVISRARNNKADIVSFPELAICGYPPEDLLLKRHFISDNITALGYVIKKTTRIVAIIGFVDTDKNGNLYNAAAIIQNGKLKGIYHKRELPNYGVFDEKRYFKPGETCYIFELNKARFGVNICEDIWKPGGIAKMQASQGARIIINISASPYYAGKIDLRKNMLIKRAKQTRCYICYNNLIGAQDELVFDGGSMIIAPDTEQIIFGKQFEEDLVIADLSISTSENKVSYKDCIVLDRLKKTRKKTIFTKRYDKPDRIAEIYNALVLGTRDYIRKNGFKGVVIGLSGGIDSSLTAVIACDAIGRKNVIGVSMPSRYSSKQTQYDANILARNLGIRFITIPINSILDTYLIMLSNQFSSLKREITEQNIQARIRGNILMALSNEFGWLVLTTGNKSETSVGYCTLYGDMAGGFAVIKDAPKTLVYELAKFRNRHKQLIPESVFNREPSAELKENQKDTDTLPPYPILDEVLKRYIEEDKSFEDIAGSGEFNIKTVKNVINMVDRNEYKRRQSPPGIKITPKAFGKDRRLPITNRYREY